MLPRNLRVIVRLYNGKCIEASVDEMFETTAGYKVRVSTPNWCATVDLQQIAGVWDQATQTWMLYE
jgi:hypothetical protein